MTNYSGYAATRRAGEFRVRIFTRDLVIEGSVVTMKEKPRLSDTLNDGRLFLNLTAFETFPKGQWFASLGAASPPVVMEKGAYLAVGKAQIEALHVVDPEVDPEKT